MDGLTAEFYLCFWNDISGPLIGYGMKSCEYIHGIFTRFSKVFHGLFMAKLPPVSHGFLCHEKGMKNQLKCHEKPLKIAFFRADENFK